MSEKIGLVLEGGGVRGGFTAGALAWLNDHNIEFDYGAGISSGAVYLTCYMMKNKTAAYNIATNYACRKDVVGVPALLKEGYYVAYNKLFDDCLKKTEHFVIDPLIEENPDMEIGLYDLDQGETVFFRPKEFDHDMKILQGACALPVASGVVELNGHHYLDGGITKMIPIERAIEQGCTKFLVITTKPASYVRKPGSPAVKVLMKMMYPKYPKMVEDYSIRHLNYYKQIAIIKEQVEKGNAVHVLPSRDFPVSRFHGDPEVTKVLYKLGYDDMEARKDEIFALLGITE